MTTSPISAWDVRPAPDPTDLEQLVEVRVGSADDHPGEALWRYEAGSALFSWPDFEQSRYGVPARPSIDQLETMLARDGKAATLEQVLTLPLRGAAPSLEPAKGDSGEYAVISELLLRPSTDGGMASPLALVLGQATSATWQRRAYFELCFRVTDVDGTPRVGYAEIAHRPARTCWVLRDPKTLQAEGIGQTVPKINERGDVDGVTQIAIPKARSAIYVHGQHRRPLDGTGDLDVSYFCWDTKRKIRFLWSYYLEHVALGRIVAEAPPSGGAAAVAGAPTTPRGIASAIAATRGGGVVGVPNGTKVTTLESSGSAQFQACLDWLSAEQAGSVLAGWTDLVGPGRSGRGSLALSQDQTDFFSQGRDSVLREMGAWATSDLIAPLVRWNFGASRAVPKLVFSPVTDTNGQQLVTLLQAIAGGSTGSGDGTGTVGASGGKGSLIPRAFIDELTLKTAAYLNLDVDKIRAALTSAPGPSVDAPGPLGEVATAVDRATRLVAAHRAIQAVPDLLASHA